MPWRPTAVAAERPSRYQRQVVPAGGKRLQSGNPLIAARLIRPRRARTRSRIAIADCSESAGVSWASLIPLSYAPRRCEYVVRKLHHALPDTRPRPRQQGEGRNPDRSAESIGDPVVDA